MNVTKVTYGKLVSTGNFSNEKLEITVELDEGDTPADALKRARAFVEAAIGEKPSEFELSRARARVDNPDDYPPKEVRAAQELLSRAEQSDIPF